MKQIALVFAHNDESIIDLFIRCVVSWSDRNNGLSTVRFTVVVAPRLAEMFEGKYGGIGIVPINAFQQNKFTEVVNCSNLLLGVSPTKYQSIIDKKFHDIVTPNRYNLEHGLVFESIFNACDGYGSSAESMAISLAENMPVSFKPGSSTPQSHALAHPSLLKILNNFELGSHYIYYSVPHVTKTASIHIAAHAKTALLTMFESTRIPCLWPNAINQFNHLLVPSNFCKEVFVNCGVSVPTHVVPLGIIPERWPLVKRTEDRPFRFLLFANSHWGNSRKNYAFALEMFTKVFGGRKDVELWLKLTEGGSPPHVGKASNVRVIVDRYDHAQLLQMMNQCDCLLFPSNGEGFGLPPREAAATGMSVIYTDWGALTDLSALGIGYPVPPGGLQPAAYPDPRLLYANNGSSYIGDYARQNEPALIAKMKWVLNNRDKAMLKGIKDSRFLKKHETYAQTAAKIIEVMS